MIGSFKRTLRRPRPRGRRIEPNEPAIDSGEDIRFPKRVGIAFQRGSFLAGAVHTGVVQALTEMRVFDSEYQPVAFSGTSAGGLVAAVCWEATLAGNFYAAKDVLKKLWQVEVSPTEYV